MTFCCLRGYFYRTHAHSSRLAFAWFGFSGFILFSVDYQGACAVLFPKKSKTKQNAHLLSCLCWVSLWKTESPFPSLSANGVACATVIFILLSKSCHQQNKNGDNCQFYCVQCHFSYQLNKSSIVLTTTSLHSYLLP